MDSFLVYVGDVTHDLGSSINVIESLILHDFTFNEMAFTHASPAQVDITVTNTGAGLVAMGSVAATLRTECSRCLEPFEMPVVGTIEAFFTTADRAIDLPEGQEWSPIQGETVDVLPGVLAAILVELPIAPVHSDDCRGICPKCGCDLNENRCECPSDAKAPNPFEALRSLQEETD
ncbi:MAG: DUF177 domain-containing protein [Actinobacteria bacterium]|nr:DUF177 domain-containing protein [Actinomycetota bacterium]MCL5887016.1 DUF177 domain-containing protein [Actinomycetota bacterium]